MANADVALRGFTFTAVALAGFLFSLTPAAERLDNALMDVEWRLLRQFAPKPAPDEVVIVGVDDASVRGIDAPPGLWHEPIGRALERIASARPRAIALDFPLPERSYETFHPGLDRPLVQGLAEARKAAPLVASLTIDPRTRAARPVHSPFLAALGIEGLGIGLLGRDADGATRRFSLAIPTEDGTFPTVTGRLCRVMARRCGDGLIDFALGEPLRYVPLREVLAAHDAQYLGKLFRDRVVFIGDVRASDRNAVPVNLAGWETAASTSPTVVVQAQSFRTAVGEAPVEAAAPLAALLPALAALVALMRRWRLALATALAAGVLLLAAGTALLRAHLFVGLAAPLVTALAAVATSAYAARRRR
jgi:CHASE2 domain-containing sensor protein